jgi:hypothetical protein
MHGRHKHEPRRKGRRAHRPRDGHHALFQGLPQHLQAPPMELGNFVQEQHPVAGISPVQCPPFLPGVEEHPTPEKHQSGDDPSQGSPNRSLHGSEDGWDRPAEGDRPSQAATVARPAPFQSGQFFDLDVPKAHLTCVLLETDATGRAKQPRQGAGPGGQLIQVEGLHQSVVHPDFQGLITQLDFHFVPGANGFEAGLVRGTQTHIQ